MLGASSFSQKHPHYLTKTCKNFVAYRRIVLAISGVLKQSSVYCSLGFISRQMHRFQRLAWSRSCISTVSKSRCFIPRARADEAGKAEPSRLLLVPGAEPRSGTDPAPPSDSGASRLGLCSFSLHLRPEGMRVSGPSSHAEQHGLAPAGPQAPQ